MTVSELITLLNNYDPNMQVVSPDGICYSILSEDEVQEKSLFPDFTDYDNSIGKDGEAETYLMISTNQFN